MGTLPRAIRVKLVIKPMYGMSEQELEAYNKGKEVPPTEFFFVITVPTTPVVSVPATEETTETTDSSSTTSSTGTSSGSTGGTTSGT